MKVFVFVLLLGTALCVSYDTESGDKKPFVTNDDIGIKYHKAVNYVKENYKSACPGAADYKWGSVVATESQLVSGMVYRFELTVTNSEKKIRKYSVLVQSPATKDGRTSITSCTLIS